MSYKLIAMKLLNISTQYYKKISLLFFALVLTTTLFGQDTADFARSMGKMNIVIAVIATVFIGIVLFLIYMERKVAKLEKRTRNQIS